MARDFRTDKYQLSDLDWSVLGLEVTFRLLCVFLQCLNAAGLFSLSGLPIRIHPWSLSNPGGYHGCLVTRKHYCTGLQLD